MATRSPQAWAGLAVLWLALLLRVLTPPGYMLSAAPEGGLPFVTICTAQGAKPVTAQRDLGETHQGPAHPNEGAKGDHICAWSGLGSPSLAAPPETGARAEWASSRPIFIAHAVSVPGRGLAAPPPPSTGPPLSI